MSVACSVLLFDCDGVILDSNPIKTEAFRAALSDYPRRAVDRLVAFHEAHGGLSRYAKFKMFFTEIMQQPADEAVMTRVLERFGAVCRRRYLEVPLTPSCARILESLASQIPLFVVSGSDEAELRDVFLARRLSRYFQGIYGCPRSKSDCVTSILDELGSAEQVAFIGDSYLDWQTAQAHHLAFVFMARCSDATERMRREAAACPFPIIDTLAELPGLLAVSGRSHVSR